MITRPRMLPIALLTVCAALTLTGCQPEWLLGGSGGGAPSSNPTASSDASAQPDDTDEAGVDLSGCPIGSWTLNNESWAESLGAFLAAEGMAGTTEVTGELHLDWKADGTYLLEAVASQYDVSGSSFAMRITHNGTESGTWVDEGSDSWTLTGLDESGLDSVVMIGESRETLQTMTMGTTAPDPWSGTMTIGCTATDMTTTVTDEAGSLTVAWDPRS